MITQIEGGVNWQSFKNGLPDELEIACNGILSFKYPLRMRERARFELFLELIRRSKDNGLNTFLIIWNSRVNKISNNRDGGTFKVGRHFSR